MKILIFLHGTIIMHKNGVGVGREERVKQVKDSEYSVYEYASYVQIGNASVKLKSWHNQGAQILYLSSHESAEDVGKDKTVLEKFNFPSGEIFFRQNGQTYGNLVEKIMPDILIEDDCESIGGEKETSFFQVKPEMREKIKSIIVKEFAGIDNLPDEISVLMNF